MSSDPKIVCKTCNIAKTWECFTIAHGPLAGTIIYSCSDCYEKMLLEPVEDTEDRELERLRRNTYARVYYRTHIQTNPRRKKTPEEQLEARRQASRRRNEKLKALTELERIKRAIDLLEKHGFKIS